jgi:hypothetical protein
MSLRAAAEVDEDRRMMTVAVGLRVYNPTREIQSSRVPVVDVT